MPRAPRRTPRTARRRWAAALFAGPACLGLGSDARGAGGPAGERPVGVRSAVTRSAGFALPAGDLGDRTGLVAVRLFRSTDGGTSWAPAGTFPPDAARLPHEVPRDGEYLFSVRGLDRRGGLHPASGPTAEYAVTVDTVGPALTLKGWWAGEDRVRLTLRCEDPHLVRDSVRLRWLSADPAAGWEDVRPAPDEASSWEGLVRIDATRALGTPFDISVRATALDAAGNRSEAVLPLPRPSAVSATAAADLPALRFAVPRPADPPPRRLPATATRAGFAETVGGAAVEPAGGGLPAAAFPVAAFPVAAFPAAEPDPARAGDFPVARFRLPDEPPPPAAPADGPEVWFDLGRHAAPAAVVPAAAAVPAPPPAAAPAADDADALYERLLAAAPGDRALRLAYADRLHAAGRPGDAARHLRVLLRKDPADADALRRLTACLAPAR